MNQIKGFLKDAEGSSAVEYGLLLGLIAMAILGAASSLFGSLTNPFFRVNNGLNP